MWEMHSCTLRNKVHFKLIDTMTNILRSFKQSFIMTLAD